VTVTRTARVCDVDAEARSPRGRRTRRPSPASEDLRQRLPRVRPRDRRASLPPRRPSGASRGRSRRSRRRLRSGYSGRARRKQSGGRPGRRTGLARCRGRRPSGGATGVRTFLAAPTLCGSDRHGVLAELEAAGLVDRADQPVGGCAYRPTTPTIEAVDALRDGRDPRQRRRCRRDGTGASLWLPRPSSTATVSGSSDVVTAPVRAPGSRGSPRRRRLPSVPSSLSLIRRAGRRRRCARRSSDWSSGLCGR
jgi:hypothetical protein